MRGRVGVILLIGVVCAPALAWAGDNQADKAKLQGAWVTVSLVDKGTAEKEGKVKMLKLIFKGDKYIYQLGATTFTATFKLDATAKPRSIDVTFEEGPIKGKTMKAIYALDGDELKICGGDKRPTEFTATKEAGTILFTFKREKQ